ncbi:MAG TPA: hypothetical protein VKG84_14625, partial [Candidatus Acidoferrales bacterium]|nr:hypothetical protein [Candidatus Acidoferrales bacterium]
MKLSKRNRWPVVLFLLPLFLLPALRVGRADGQELPWNGAHFAADPAAVLAASSTIARDPSAAATIFLEERHLILDSEERVRMTLLRVYRVESQAGVEAWSETGSEWWPWRQKRPEVRARVIAPDGAI